MATDKQLAANRKNAQHSTGPKTARGKSTSARNARRHSIFQSIASLTGRERRDFNRLAREYHHQFQPADCIEEDLVCQFVEARWRLLMCRKTESGFFDEAADRYLKPGEPTEERHLNRAFARAIMDDPANSLIKLVRYEQIIRRGFDRAFRAFFAHRDSKNDKTNPIPDNAKPLPANYFPSNPDILARAGIPSNEPNSKPNLASPGAGTRYPGSIRE